MIGRLTALLLLALSSPVLALDPAAPESCATGPVIKTYGGTKWLVASCSDGKSLVFVFHNRDDAGGFHTTFTWHPENKTWAMDMDNVTTSGKALPFARTTLKAAK